METIQKITPEDIYDPNTQVKSELKTLIFDIYKKQHFNIFSNGILGKLAT